MQELTKENKDNKEIHQLRPSLCNVPAGLEREKRRIERG